MNNEFDKNSYWMLNDLSVMPYWSVLEWDFVDGVYKDNIVCMTYTDALASYKKRNPKVDTRIDLVLITDTSIPEENLKHILVIGSKLHN